MQNELRELLDKQAITEVIHSYAQGIDRKDPALLRMLFTADAMLHYGSYDNPAKFLVDHWRPDVPSEFLVTHHLVGNILIRLYGKSRARSITYLYAVHRANRQGQLVDEMVRARYLDRLVKQDGRWKFQERTLVFDWSRVVAPDATNWWDSLGGTALTGGHGDADPSAGFLSEMDAGLA